MAWEGRCEVVLVPRGARGVIINTYAHVVAKGNRSAAIFPQSEDYRNFLRYLQDYAADWSVRVHAYCLMSTHVHLLLEIGERPLAGFMQRLLQRHAQHINGTYGHRGHVFGDRYWSRRCESDLDLLGVLRYIHLNPVQAGLVQDPQHYAWCGHRAYLGRETVPWLARSILTLFSADHERAVDAYAEFMQLELELLRRFPARGKGGRDRGGARVRAGRHTGGVPATQMEWGILKRCGGAS